MSTIKNVGELRALIAGLPDDLRIQGSIEIYTQPPSPPIKCDSSKHTDPMEGLFDMTEEESHDLDKQCFGS